MAASFRSLAGFGKRMEYNLVGKMLMEGLDCYLPLVDDHGVDCVIKKSDGTFIEIQIKAANVIYLPLDKIKDIVVDEKATARRGNVIIILAGREKPVTLIDVAFPQEVLDFYRNLIDSEGNPDPIKIF